MVGGIWRDSSGRGGSWGNGSRRDPLPKAVPGGERRWIVTGVGRYGGACKRLFFYLLPGAYAPGYGLLPLRGSRGALMQPAFGAIVQVVVGVGGMGVGGMPSRKRSGGRAEMDRYRRGEVWGRVQETFLLFATGGLRPRLRAFAPAGLKRCAHATGIVARQFRSWWELGEWESGEQAVGA
jgi:hypothetical protein